MKDVVNAEILQKRELAPNIYEMIVDANNILKESKPGQFIHIKCSDDVFLRRPISICEVKDNRLRFIFEVRGKGTGALSKRREGEALDILGPLGNGFGVSKKFKNPVVIGGGIGIYPLLGVANAISAGGLKPKAILGFRAKELVTLEADFNNVCEKVFITTDDGSYGEKGLVTEVLVALLEKEEIDAVFACGPMPMLKALNGIAKNNNIYLEISLEERMGCGLGVCLCCPAKIKDNDLEGGFTYSHVCVNGPVFNGNEVIF